MPSNNEALWIGSRYRWGDRYEHNSTSLAGFFYDTQRGGRIVALTIRPPSGYESEYADRIEIVEGLLCLLRLDGKLIDRDKKQTTVFKSIHHLEIPFRSSCELVAARDERLAASVVGVNRAVRIKGNVYRGLYELSTPSSVAGMAGAPVVRQGALAGLIVADGGRYGAEHRAFAVPTYGLMRRLSPLSAGKLDREYSDRQALKMASWGCEEELEIEGA